ncbi:MAG TPA: YciI family protein [Solirubrobacteraceae bacterium]
MLSIYVDPTAEGGAEMSEWWAYNQAAEKAGVFVAGDALEAPTTATTVRLRSGERLLTDGPFAETKEQLGGFYILDCKDLDEAISWAERVPSLAHYGAIEVRPLMEYEQAPAGNGATAEQAAS